MVVMVGAIFCYDLADSDDHAAVVSSRKGEALAVSDEAAAHPVTVDMTRRFVCFAPTSHEIT
jgi:hypothetical protein